MRPLTLSVAATRDLNVILYASAEQFGEAVANRYRRLISAALRDLRADDTRPGVQLLSTGARLYHLRHSRRRVTRGRIVSRPRHLLVFRIADGEIVVLRVLHDAMDLPAHLQDL